MRIDQPGVYEISADEYHADNFLPEPSLSSSIAKLLVTPGGTPLHARTECPRLNPDYEPDERSMFDLGAAAHSLILGDERKFEIMDFADWRSKEARNLRDEARALGKIPILTDQWERTIAMVAAARVQLDAHEEAHTFFVQGSGTPEQTLIWCEGDVWMRCRLDWNPTAPPLYPDFKSTGASADPDLWSRTMYGMGADMQAAFYCRGIRALGLCDRPEWRFVVQENYKPYALSVIGLMPGALDLANWQVEKAIGIWAEARRANLWPGYPRRTCFIDAPEYLEANILNREERARETDPALHAAADKFHRPLQRIDQ